MNIQHIKQLLEGRHRHASQLPDFAVRTHILLMVHQQLGLLHMTNAAVISRFFLVIFFPCERV